MKDINDNIIVLKSMEFAVRCVNLCKYLRETQKEYDISKQLFRSGTSIGANVKEGIRGQTRTDFRAKMNISLKEASETEYWLELLHQTNYLSTTEAQSMLHDCVELIKILTSIVKTTEE